eukprot:m.126737 g.126737  ORF g.126737 m.126737 type:complete len:184 (+) comp12997_c0_seq11:2674-3225(+)
MCTIVAMCVKCQLWLWLTICVFGCTLFEDDNVPAPVPFPKIYWNAAGAMYAYLVGELTKIGFEVLGQSQLAGTPPQPQWDIHESQYPSVSLLDWTTGLGNGRYWVLKLLIEEFGPGDLLVNTSIPSSPHIPMCAKVDGHAGYTNVTLSCAEEGAVISAIEFASFGTPTGFLSLAVYHLLIPPY